MPRTKIIATLGPASNNYTVLRKMFTASLNVVRMNFSHGTKQSHLESLKLVRRLNKKYRRHIEIMQDLEGFRIRVGFFEGTDQIELKTNTDVTLKNNTDTGGPRTIPFDYQGNLSAVKAGHPIFIDDGNLLLKVKSVSSNAIKAKVLEGGILKQRKGINFPESKLEFGAITDKDKTDIQFAIEHKLEYVALSFVRDSNDVEEAAGLTKPKHPRCKIIAKIENRQAIANIDDIINAADGIMVARGDMGVAIPVYEVPVVQKKIIKKCNQAGKFVITATQMLEHMTEHSRPTRAEVTDVANAILDGTDFVMLSAETAVGKNPDKCVAMMNDIIKFTEKYQDQIEKP